jgi:L-serine deaminase
MAQHHISITCPPYAVSSVLKVLENARQKMGVGAAALSSGVAFVIECDDVQLEQYIQWLQAVGVDFQVN